MGDLTQQTTINASPESVFKFVADPHNAPRYISSINRIISGPSGLPTIGQDWQAEANFLGRHVTVTLRLVELVPNRLVHFTMEGEPQAILTLHIAPGDKAPESRVSLTLEVPSVPSIFLTAIMSGLLAGDMSRLKGLLES